MLLIDFFHFSSLIVGKIEASSRKYSLSKLSRKQIMEKKIIQCSLKVSFPGQRNPQKYRIRSKIISFKA